MREINLTELLPDIVLRFQREQENVGVPIFLTLPPDLPSLTWRDNGLEMLLFNLFNHAIFGEHLGRPIRISVGRKKEMIDLEALVKIHPSYWIQLRMDMQSISEPDAAINRELAKSRFFAEDEWVREGSPDKLIAYGQKNDTEPQLFCWIQHNRASHRYMILIPVRIEN